MPGVLSYRQECEYPRVGVVSTTKLSVRPSIIPSIVGTLVPLPVVSTPRALWMHPSDPWLSPARRDEGRVSSKRISSSTFPDPVPGC